MDKVIKVIYKTPFSVEVWIDGQLVSTHTCADNESMALPFLKGYRAVGYEIEVIPKTGGSEP